MKHSEALSSGTPPKIRKAAKAIARNNETGYCDQLLSALESLLDKPKSWQTQSDVIKALGATDCQAAVPRLKQLIEQDYKATVLYRDLGYAIAILDGLAADKLDFLYSSFDKANELQICGVCAAIVTEEIIPAGTDIERIIEAVSAYEHLEERGITAPRTYIAAVAYLWPKEDVQAFLQSCTTSPSKLLVSIATDSLAGKKTDKIIA